MNAVELIALSKRYKNGRGIKDISLAVERGQIYGLLGPNGSGKTTIMKLMSGLLVPDSGDLKLHGISPLNDPLSALQQVGCLIESPAFYPYLTARKNLELIGALKPAGNAARIDHVLELTGLDSVQNHLTRTYSLGMKQRLGIAMAIVSEPALLILDEPCNGLDIEGMADVRNILRSYAQKDRTVFISSHLAGEMEQICTHIAVICNGQVIDTATMAQIKEQYGTVEDYYMTMIQTNKEALPA